MPSIMTPTMISSAVRLPTSISTVAALQEYSCDPRLIRDGREFDVYLGFADPSSIDRVGGGVDVVADNTTHS